MIHKIHELTAESAKKLDFALNSRGIEKRDLIYIFASFVQVWICTWRPKRIYPHCLDDFRYWESEIIGDEPNLPGVYHYGAAADSDDVGIILDRKTRSTALKKWEKEIPGSVIQTWRKTIIPPRHTTNMKKVLRYYEGHPQELIDRYEYVSGDAKRLMANLNASNYSLNALFNHMEEEIAKVIFDELPIEIISSVAAYCGRTRGQARISNEMAKFKAGFYHNPLSNEDVEYKGGRLPKALSRWCEEHGHDLVKAWKQ